MNQPQTLSPIPSDVGSNGNLDTLLSEFFKKEMPTPWPKAPALRIEVSGPISPSKMQTVRPKESIITPSRVSLAFSVALLIGGCWFLSDRVDSTPPKSGMGFQGTMAKDPLLKRINEPAKDSKPMP